MYGQVVEILVFSVICERSIYLYSLNFFFMFCSCILFHFLWMWIVTLHCFYGLYMRFSPDWFKSFFSFFWVQYTSFNEMGERAGRGFVFFCVPVMCVLINGFSVCQMYLNGVYDFFFFFIDFWWYCKCTRQTCFTLCNCEFQLSRCHTMLCNRRKTCDFVMR